MRFTNPSPEARAVLSQRVVVPLVGATCVGKNTLMDALVEGHPEFHRVTGFTTREKHDGEAEDTYRAFLPDDESTRAGLLAATGDDELVQCETHPTTKHLYGTMVRDYAGEYNVKDVLSGAIPVFRNLGFAACNVIAVVVEPEQWQARFDRKVLSNEDRVKRIQEGIISLTWALNANPKPLWIANYDGELNLTTERLHKLATGKEPPDALQEIEVAKRLLSYLQRFR